MAHLLSMPLVCEMAADKAAQPGRAMLIRQLTIILAAWQMITQSRHSAYAASCNIFHLLAYYACHMPTPLILFSLARLATMAFRFYDYDIGSQMLFLAATFAALQCRFSHFI